MQFAAAWLTLTWHTNAPDGRPHPGYSYCLPGEAGPRGWARTKTLLDSDWRAYSRALQPSNCDILARSIQAHLNF
ncbi:MAG TPA: hypothetical protein VHT03_01645 [Rhizomicrobium sp.]|nr:hypothetical protein [Rhizomicrobium sp.]